MQRYTSITCNVLLTVANELSVAHWHFVSISLRQSIAIRGYIALTVDGYQGYFFNDFKLILNFVYFLY